MSSNKGSRKVVYAALAGNVAIAVTKYAAALWTGSSAMLTEAIHSTVDSGNQGLLLFGMHRASLPPSPRHPFGHGRELYFWAFVVALMIFALGGAFSIYEGWRKIASPQQVETVWVNFAVIGAAFLFEGYSFRVAWRELRKQNADLPLWLAIRRSKDPRVFTAFLEDGAALTGLAIAAVGLALAEFLDMPEMDGVASVGIGLLLVATAMVLANETRSLLTGEAAAPDILRHVRCLITADPRVKAVDELLSVHLGPGEVLLGVTIDFREDLTGEAVEDAAQELTRRVEEAHAIITRVFLRPRRPARSAANGSPSRS